VTPGRPPYNVQVTLGFIYLILFLGGFLLALVTGLVRRLLHPTALFEDVVAPSHEHWRAQRAPVTDLLVSFVTVFGLVTLAVHGVATLGPWREIAIGVVAGLLGALALRAALGRGPGSDRAENDGHPHAEVVREIPSLGFGQIEVSVGGRTVKLAARGDTGEPIPVGTEVRILDRRESVVVVAPAGVSDERA